MYSYDVSIYDYGFSNSAITGSIYGNSISPMAGAVDYDDELYARRRPPLRQTPLNKPPSSPPKHRHDGTSPLPLGMDWNLAPLIWEGRNSVWPHDLHKGWSYCVTIPSLSSLPSDGISKSNTVFYGVKVGIQSPEGITITRTVSRRFNEFLKLYTELKKEFPKKNLPPAPPRRLMKTTSKKVLEERMSALECWITKVLSDIDVSRTATVAIFLELEAAARQACCELNQNESTATEMDNSCAHETPISEKENCGEPNIRERSTESEWDMEEVWRKCMELELRLTMEQEARACAESMKETTIKQNELLVKELNDSKEQIENLRKQKEEMELKSKSNVKEVKSLEHHIQS